MLTRGGACLDVCFMQYLGLCLPARQIALRLFIVRTLVLRAGEVQLTTPKTTRKKERHGARERQLREPHFYGIGW